MPSFMMVGDGTQVVMNGGYFVPQENQTSEMGNAVYEALPFLPGFLGLPC